MHNPLREVLHITGQNRLSTLLLVVVAVWVVTACQSPDGEAAGQADPQPVAERPSAEAAGAPYDFARPDARFELPRALEEISGLTLLDERHLGAVQDEEGVLFTIDLVTGRVVDEHRFAGRGDYEGLERMGERIFVLRSDGRLFRLENPQTDRRDVEHEDLDLPKGCDAEGLAYSVAHDGLLVSCKENAGQKGNRHRAVYAYDPDRDRLTEEPVFLIDLDALREVPPLDGIRPDDLRSFKPSALAQHPQTREWYLISSVEKMILVLGEDGRPAGTYVLPESLFAQPEGLAFLPEGDLLISNEGAGGAATLLRFHTGE